MAPYMNCFTFFQTLSLIYMLVTVTCTGSSLSHDEECSALFQFKQSMIHKDDVDCAARWFYTFQSWKPTSNASDAGFDCCSWYGVECSNHGHVIGLDLSESSLCGNINSTSTLFSLVHLQNLNLATNNFNHESEIPSEVGLLKQLRSLDLSDNWFSGQIPIEISQLKQLSSLDLSWNLLKLHSPSLQKLVQNLTGLQELHLSGVDISSSVPHFLANFSSLRSIRLSNCSLQNEFPSTILQLPNMKYLDLSYNTNLTGSLPDFCNNTLLEHLNLAYTGFSGRIPASISNLTQLSYLNFRKNSSPTSLANLTGLSYVNMRKKSFFDHIPSSFFNLTQLTHLNLAGNLLEGPISNSISNFQNLQYLDLSLNIFSGRVDFDTFVGFRKLQFLFLGYNNISLAFNTNYTNTTLPELEELQLSSCNLKEFPSFLGFQNKLTTLLLDGNKIDGLVPVWIWNNSQETLQAIDLSYNSITGFHQHPHFLPWRRLEVFSIRSNHLRGQLPIPPQTTAIYDFSNNNLQGQIPASICKVQSLQQLDLSYNMMTGTVPSCLGSLNNSLTILNLRGNNFHVIMKNMFMQGSLLRNIDLSENGFIGLLPRSLANCTKLEVLILGDNSFHDVFPSWLGTLPNLQVLILGSNKLYGPIQSSTTVLSQFPKLRIIDLSNNNFSGQLQENYFQTWNAMKVVGELSVMESIIHSGSVTTTKPYTMKLVHKGVRTEYPQVLTINMAIDLSCNHFEGEIPLSLQDLQGLESLNLSNNHFTGRVLPSLGYLKNLESLDFSTNELSGELPQELVKLNFLSNFNVSFNNLEGRIPHGKQFDTFDNSSYIGNSQLCGQPLSKECHGSKDPKLPPASNTFKLESLLPSEMIDWIIIFFGVGSGLVIGVVIGNVLYIRYNDRFRKRKDIWIRPLRNTRRNQGVS